MDKLVRFFVLIFVGAVLVSTSTVNGVFLGECDSYEREKVNEGYFKCVYKDPRGIPTIGVGFNLKKLGAREEIESVGTDYDKVLSGAECLSDSQIEQLFNTDMDSAVGCASSWVDNWSSIGSGPQSAISDMAFNMGCATLRTFTTLKSYIEKSDFSGAAQDMQGTAWCRQVGNRCSRDVSCMEEGLDKKQNGIL